MNAPKRGRKYQEVVNRGCGLRYYPYEGDYDCDHKYDWDCEDCPCGVEIEKITRSRGGDMDARYFLTLRKRDFENEAVIDEIYKTLKTTDTLKAEIERRNDMLRERGEIIVRLIKETTSLEEQIKLLNPCGHTEFESISCDVCGYPDSRKLITALKAERDRLRETLNEIASGNRTAHESMLWARQTLKENI